MKLRTTLMLITFTAMAFCAWARAVPAPPEEQGLTVCNQVKSDDGTCFNYCTFYRNGEVVGYASWYGC